MNAKPDKTGLLEKFLHNQCTDDELDKVRALLLTEDYREQLQPLLSVYLNSPDSFRPAVSQNELDQMLNSLHHRINIEGTQPRRKIVRFRQIAVRAAAILFVPMLLVSIWTTISRNEYGNDNFITLETLPGSKLKTTLPDGTEVWQNAGSTLRYPVRFHSRKREVSLTGEAYFHVTSDKKHPFLVKTNEGTVTVTGTKFNVSSYPDDTSCSVVLEKGQVSFQAENSPVITHLQPSEQILLDKRSGKLERTTIDIEKYISWTTGKLIFRNDPLTEVVGRLSRWFNADIKIVDPGHELGDYTFTLTVQQETIEQVLQYITQASGLKLTREESVSNSSIVKTNYKISK